MENHTFRYKLVYRNDALDPKRPLAEQVNPAEPIELTVVTMPYTLHGLRLVINDQWLDNPSPAQLIRFQIFHREIIMRTLDWGQFNIAAELQCADFAAAFLTLLYVNQRSHEFRVRHEEWFRGLLQNPNYLIERDVEHSLPQGIPENSNQTLTYISFLRSILEGARVNDGFATELYAILHQIENVLRDRLERDGVTDDDILKCVQLVYAFLYSSTFHRLFIERID